MLCLMTEHFDNKYVKNIFKKIVIQKNKFGSCAFSASQKSSHEPSLVSKYVLDKRKKCLRVPLTTLVEINVDSFLT